MKKFRIAILVVLMTAGAGSALAQQSQQPQVQQAQAPANAMVHPGALYDAGVKLAQVVDAGQQIGMLWDNGSVVLKRTVKREDFVATVTRTRAGIGALSARNWRGVQHQYSTGGQIPAGEYASVSFAIVASGKPANEVVTFRHDEDGMWRFVGYVIQR